MVVVAVSMMHMMANHVVGQALKRCQHVDHRNSYVRVDDPGPEVLEYWDEPVHVNQSYTHTHMRLFLLEWTGLDRTGPDLSGPDWTRLHWT